MRLRPPPSKALHSFHRKHSLSTFPSEPVCQDGAPDSHYAHLLQMCLQQCKYIKAHKVFDEMPERLLAHASRTCKTIHARSLKIGIASKGFLGNAILGFYAKCGNAGFAKKAFNCLESKDVFAWNSVLSMYSSKGLVEQVVKLFGLMWDDRVMPNEFTFTMVLSACARLVDVEYGGQVHCGVIKMGFELSSFCGGSLIDMYAKGNCISDARQIFDGVLELDTVAGTTMISGYVQAGLLKEALKVFKEMQRVGCFLDQVGFVTVINACVGLGRLDDACELFSQMPSPNVVAWNVLISGHAKRGNEEEVVNFFLRMRKAGKKPTRSTLGSVLSTIASLAALDYGLLVHDMAIKLGLDSNFYVGSSLINMYAKCDKMDSLKKIFDYLPEKNVVLWNAMLGGYAQNGYASEVIELFSNMKGCGLCPDEFTYTSILSTCSSLVI